MAVVYTSDRRRNIPVHIFKSIAAEEVGNGGQFSENEEERRGTGQFLSGSDEHHQQHSRDGEHRRGRDSTMCRWARSHLLDVGQRFAWNGHKVL